MNQGPLDTFRRHYAAKANTFEMRIKYWNELTGLQKNEASALFQNTEMEEHIYEMGRSGMVISRQRIHPNDPAYNPNGAELARFCGDEE